MEGRKNDLYMETLARSIEHCQPDPVFKASVDPEPV